MAGLAVNLSARCADAIGGTSYATLLAAPGLRVAFDSDYGHSRAATVTEWTARYGGVTASQSTSNLRPAWGSVSANGRAGITFTQASNQRLVATHSFVAAMGAASYSAIVVERAGGTAATRCTWGVGSSADSSQAYEAITSTGADAYRRVTAAAASATISGGITKPAGAYVRVSTYDVATTFYNSWVDGAVSLVNGSNVRTQQSALMDMLFFGSAYSYPNTWSTGTGSTLFFLGLAPGVIWSAAWVARLQRAAKAIWGTA